MIQPNEIKLFGTLRSGYCDIVHHALRLKGLVYEYIEEDVTNKSKEFLKMNPVYKKVPTLVVGGKPIPESLVILQYIDETWPQPPLMPHDPYQRSKFIPGIYAIIISEGEAKMKALDEFLTIFKTLEEGLNKDKHSEGPFIHGLQAGLLDVILGGCYSRFKLMESSGVKLLDETHLLQVLCIILS